MQVFYENGEFVESTTTVKRGKPVYCPALSTVHVHISGTATVNLNSNPFGDAAKDFLIGSLSASNNVIISAATFVVVDVTAVTGTVSVSIIPNRPQYAE